MASSSKAPAGSPEEFDMGPPNFSPFGTVAENTWTEPPGSEWLVRGPDYLKQSGKNVVALKQPSGDSPYHCIGVNVFKSPVSMMHSANKIEEFRKFLAENATEEEEGGMPLFLVIAWMFSNFFGTEHTFVQHVFRRTWKPKGEDAALDAAMSRFLAADDAGKNEQFKYMFKVIEGPPMMISAVSTLGGERPVIIGKKLTTSYFRGKNYLEIDMDVGSSVMASMLNSTILQTAATAIIDESWLIEAQRDEELPERVMAKCRWNYAHPDVLFVMLNENGERA